MIKHKWVLYKNNTSSSLRLQEDNAFNLAVVKREENARRVSAVIGTYQYAFHILIEEAYLFCLFLSALC